MNKQTSVYLDIVRPLAALLVFFSHIHMVSDEQMRVWFYPAGGQGVALFFVLSGFVIAHVTATKEKDAASYFSSRAIRIYSVAIPALIVTWAADRIGQSIDPQLYTDLGGAMQPFGFEAVWRSLTFTGELWSTHVFPGTNAPWWSMGYEIAYYIGFGALMFLPNKLKWVGVTAVMLLVGHRITLMAPNWIMGVVAYHVCARGMITRRLGWWLLSVPLVLLVAYEFTPLVEVMITPTGPSLYNRFVWRANSYVVAMLFTIHLIGFSAVASGAWFMWAQKPIRWVAGATFTLYLMHVPLMCLMAAVSPFPKSSPLMVVWLLVSVLVLVFLLAEVSERRKNWFKRALQGAWGFYKRGEYAQGIGRHREL